MSEATELPALGHNNPPRDTIIDMEDAIAFAKEQAEQFAKRTSELTAGFERWQAANTIEMPDGKKVIRIMSDDVQGRSGDLAKLLRKHADAVEAVRKATKEPVLELGKAVDAVFKFHSDAALGAKTTIEAAQTVYLRQRAAGAAKAAQEERDRLQAQADAEAARLNAEAELARAEAELNGEPEPVIAAPLVAPVIAMPSTQEISRVHGDFSLTSGRAKWVYEVTDAEQVPRQYLMVNPDAIKAAIKGGARQIAGLNIFQETKVVNK